MVDYLKPPAKPLPAPIDGHLLDQIRGSVVRPIVPAGLSPFMRLPDPEPRTIVRARMAELIARVYSATGCVTRDDLLGAGFTAAEIEEHFTAAKRIARVADMQV